MDIPLVTGSDLVAALLAALNAPGSPARKVLVAGPQDEAVAALRAVFPNVEVEVMPAPSGLAKSPVLRSEVARACRARPWDILLLCVGGPAQQLIAREIETLGRPNGVALCVGAAIDFATGRRKRAPAWMQQRGLEWAYRLWREPARLWRRYLVESPRFSALRPLAPAWRPAPAGNLTLRSWPPHNRLPKAHRGSAAREARGLHRLDGTAKQARRTADAARRIGDVVGIEDQPAIAGAGLADDAVELRRRERAVVEFDDAEHGKIDRAGIDAFINAAAGVEAALQLTLSQQRRPAERIEKLASAMPGQSSRNSARLRRHSSSSSAAPSVSTGTWLKVWQPISWPRA